MTVPDPSPAAPAGRVAVVTGSDSGIGRATAVRLAEAGLDVGITWHTDEEGAERTAEEVRAHGRRAEVARLDLTRLPDAAGVVDDLAERLGRIDVLVNNSGTGTATPSSTSHSTTSARSSRWICSARSCAGSGPPGG